MNNYPITVVDNFYKCPDKIRDFALSQPYTFCRDMENIDYVYPGARTQDLSIIHPELFEKFFRKTSSIFHNYEYDLLRWQVSSSFQYVTEDFDCGIIHQDHNTVFAGVIYLTPNAPLTAGTSIYAPNKLFNKKNYQEALNENDTLFKSGALEVKKDYHHMFDETVKVNNLFNTLIMYEGDMFHSANHFFGSNIESARLVQVFFVNRVDVKSESSFPISRAKAIEI
jgi:hypothetical protein